jgi:hypothetical protein
MKKQMLLALWLPLIAIIAFISCKKTVTSGSYEVRQYGAYQFGAAIDGVDYIPNGSPLAGVPAVTVSINSQNNGAEFDWYCGTYFLDQPNNYIRRVHLYIRNFKGVGEYKLNNLTNAFPLPRPFTYAGYYDEPWLTGAGLLEEYFMTNTRDTGYINCIKYDTNSKEFQFSYTCRSLVNNTKTKTITGTIRY